MNQGQLRYATTHVVAHCTICGQKALSTTGTDFVHKTCLAKPKPCQCGAASMPHPNCTHCKGSGRKKGELCPHCPPGPCITCTWETLHTRIIEARNAPTP